jgi:hypothetical protein
MLEDNNDTVYSVSKGTVTSGAVIIPATYNGLPVTGIHSFANTNITSITIPASVTYISEGAFRECESLTSINVASGNSNYSSEGGILYNKAKTELLAYPSASGNVTITSSVTSIGAEAFGFCRSLTSVTIPASVTSIGQNAFWYTGITSVTIPSSVTTIGWGVFLACESLTSVTIQAGVTSIGEGGTFAHCSSLTSITIPASVTSIRYDTFWNCTGLTSIIIPASVTTIGLGAFRDWTSSQTINVQGKANQAAADAAWGANWRNGCNAVINYNAP